MKEIFITSKRFILNFLVKNVEVFHPHEWFTLYNIVYFFCIQSCLFIGHNTKRTHLNRTHYFNEPFLVHYSIEG